MTKNAFVTEVNSAITTWLSNHTTEGYEAYHYVYQAANYPVIQQVKTTASGGENDGENGGEGGTGE